MGVYSSTEVYPSEFDEIDTSDCNDCTFECWEAGYCIKENGLIFFFKI